MIGPIQVETSTSLTADKWIIKTTMTWLPPVVVLDPKTIIEVKLEDA